MLVFFKNVFKRLKRLTIPRQLVSTQLTIELIQEKYVGAYNKLTASGVCEYKKQI